MKEKFLNICRVMLGLLGISAVSACNEDPTPPDVVAEYGVLMLITWSEER